MPCYMALISESFLSQQHNFIRYSLLSVQRSTSKLYKAARYKALKLAHKIKFKVAVLSADVLYRYIMLIHYLELLNEDEMKVAPQQLR